MTFGNVLEWSCDTVGVDVEPGLDDDDDGKTVAGSILLFFHTYVY